MDGLDRNQIVLTIVDAMMRNNELRHDLSKGQALSKGENGPLIARIFDFAEGVMAEAAKRDESKS